MTWCSYIINHQRVNGINTSLIFLRSVVWFFARLWICWRLLNHFGVSLMNAVVHVTFIITSTDRNVDPNARDFKPAQCWYKDDTTSSSVFTTGRIGRWPPLLGFSEVIFWEKIMYYLGAQSRYTFFVSRKKYLSHFVRNCLIEGPQCSTYMNNDQQLGLLLRRQTFPPNLWLRRGAQEMVCSIAFFRKRNGRETILTHCLWSLTDPVILLSISVSA